MQNTFASHIVELDFCLSYFSAMRVASVHLIDDRAEALHTTRECVTSCITLLLLILLNAIFVSRIVAQCMLQVYLSSTIELRHCAQRASV